MFQSLIGFKINWNEFKKALERPDKVFQSLIGFKINWNEKVANMVRPISLVSIPNRV